MDSLLGLDGKKALIVGGGRGMGEASALLLAQAGCDIAVLDSVLERADEVAGQVRALGRNGVPIKADILDEVAVRNAVADAQSALGGLDILVTIVGQALFKPLLEVTHWTNGIMTSPATCAISSSPPAPSPLR